MPGTLTKVTPDIAAVIVDIPTSSHGLFLLPEKKVALSALRPARYETANSTQK